MSELTFNNEAEEVPFCSGTDLFETFVEILVGSKVRSGPVLKTNSADSFLNMIFENHNGFFGIDAPGFYIRDSVPQVAETRFRVRTFGGWVQRFTVVWAGSLGTCLRSGTLGGWLRR